jgi:hypothetical protein
MKMNVSANRRAWFRSCMVIMAAILWSRTTSRMVFEDIHLVFQVRVAGRFIEQQDLWLRDKSPGDGNFLELATAHLINIHKAESLHFMPGKYGVHDGEIPGCDIPADIRATAEQDCIKRGQSPVSDKSFIYIPAIYRFALVWVQTSRQETDKPLRQLYPIGIHAQPI